MPYKKTPNAVHKKKNNPKCVPQICTAMSSSKTQLACLFYQRAEVRGGGSIREMSDDDQRLEYSSIGTHELIGLFFVGSFRRPWVVYKKISPDVRKNSCTYYRVTNIAVRHIPNNQQTIKK